jgi:MOB kinase activator 1
MGNKGSKQSNKSLAKSPSSAGSDDSLPSAEVTLGKNEGKNEIKDYDAAAAAVADGDAAYSFWDRNKTMIPEKKLPPGSKQSKLQETIKATMKATLGGGDVAETVKLPAGEDQNEWLAVNTVHFFNAASMIFGTCTEFCTESSCPSMSAGRAEYLWKDSKEYKKPTHLSAPKYIELLLGWVDEQISDPKIFPVEENAKFPRNFLSVVKNIYKRLFRLYAHIYCSHSEKFRSIGANAHLNTCFKHFIYFSEEFSLIEKADLAPLEKLIVKLKENDSNAKKSKETQ